MKIQADRPDRSAHWNCRTGGDHRYRHGDWHVDRFDHVDAAKHRPDGDVRLMRPIIDSTVGDVGLARWPAVLRGSSRLRMTAAGICSAPDGLGTVHRRRDAPLPTIQLPPSASGPISLVEMLVVLAPLDHGHVGPRVLSYLSNSRVKAARLQIESFSTRSTILRRYRSLSNDAGRSRCAAGAPPRRRTMERSLPEEQLRS